MAYKVRQTGDRVQDVLDDVEQKRDVATPRKNGYMSAEDKEKVDDMPERALYNYEIENIWNSVIEF